MKIENEQELEKLTSFLTSFYGLGYKHAMNVLKFNLATLDLKRDAILKIIDKSKDEIFKMPEDMVSIRLTRSNDRLSVLISKDKIHWTPIDEALGLVGDFDIQYWDVFQGDDFRNEK